MNVANFAKAPGFHAFSRNRNAAGPSEDPVTQGREIRVARFPWSKTSSCPLQRQGLPGPVARSESDRLEARATGTDPQ